MKKNKNLKFIATILFLFVGFLFVDENFIQHDSNYNESFLNKIEEFLDIFGNEYEVTANSPYYKIDKNPPQFSEDDLKMSPDFSNYSELDELNRVGQANALIGPDSMPKAPRGDISKVYPTGWHQKFYKFVDGGAVYNRCHLIAYQLTGENDNWKNLMTGTRSFNTKGMLPFENSVANYIRDTGKKVRYRVTPIFVDDELVARGVIMEAYSIEDGGKKINFRVFVRNIEEGVKIDYKTGRTKIDKNNIIK
ncbi:DNA-entry nuclease [Peptoniphilus sp. AGMB00490]|uniref:DNA-entry nuclease n=2 Tax=Peptoniphilus TaxID=162289 RepID=A0ACD6AZA5_9FIRM|nr:MULTISPECIES: DNA/RNA non-specific endonuclease [Peptoniphilus]NMW85523.1 DNA-entry nuclease [Peptoniphilus faecalis]OLR64727.1 DNA-entry nuclease [Peptoniphilus porci]